MMEEFKWTVAELLARYELEPELQDVFVEGCFDREVLSQSRNSGCAGKIFYEIDVVNIPANVLKNYALTLGNKQRVIALSKQLLGVPSLARVVCLVDCDLDHWFDGVEKTDRLRWSIFCSIESHFLTENTVNDIVVITGRSKIPNFQAFYDSLKRTLLQLYALRLADRELQLNLRWTARRKYLSKHGGTMSFRLEDYAQAVLSSNSALEKKGEFLVSVDNWLLKLNCDIRIACHGHDYTELLAWTISEFNGQKEFASQAAIERLFVLLSRSIISIGDELQ